MAEQHKAIKKVYPARGGFTCLYCGNIHAFYPDATYVECMQAAYEHAITCKHNPLVVERDMYKKQATTFEAENKYLHDKFAAVLKMVGYSAAQEEFMHDLTQALYIAVMEKKQVRRLTPGPKMREVIYTVVADMHQGSCTFAEVAKRHAITLGQLNRILEADGHCDPVRIETLVLFLQSYKLRQTAEENSSSEKNEDDHRVYLADGVRGNG